MSRAALHFAARSLAISAVGPALVSQDAISMRYDVDPETGVVRRPSHDLFGQSISGRILVFRQTKGGVATGWALLHLASLGTAPRGLVCDVVNPVFVQGAVLAGIPIMDGFESSPREFVMTGDLVEIDGARRTLRILQRCDEASTP